MSLARLIAAMDEPALIAAGSKGLVVRAKKDVEAGRVTLGENGVAEVVGESVELSATSLSEAKCTCPATGVCRHILATVLALRAAEPEAETDETATDTEALPAVSAFELAAVERFAGADWPNAVALASEGVADQGTGTVTIRFVQTEESVAFAREQSLKQAIYKGPSEARRRRVVAAAALVLAQARGVDLPEAAVKSGPRADPRTLAEARQAIEEAALALAAGTLPVARERLFTMAISARAEAVPRLASELRGVSRRMDPDALRRAEETPIALLMSLARAHALTLALEVAPEDSALCGVLARSFVPSGRRELAFLGAETWRAASGAAGFTAIFADLNSGTLHRAVHARAAGTDLNFDPRSAWNLPLWSLAPPARLGNQRIVLPDAALAPDDGLGLTQRAEWAGSQVALDDLKSCGAATDSLDALETMAESQIGLGLRARPGEAFAVVLPKHVYPPEFDPYAQKTSWFWETEDKRMLTLTLPGDSDLSDRLTPLCREVRGGLVALRPGRTEARLISLWVTDPAPISLQLQPLPKAGKISGILQRLRETGSAIGLGHTVPEGTIDPVHLVIERALEGILTGLTRTPGLPERARGDLRDLGLAALSELDEAWRSSGSSSDALRLGYALAVAQATLDAA